jgi:tetratricopeptide (TPR) repeat protein
MKRLPGVLIVFVLFSLSFSNLLKADQGDAAIQPLLQAIQANPNDATAHFNLGVAYFNSSKYELASAEFQKCLQINSNDKQARELYESSQGISAYYQKNYSVAVNHLKETLKLNPKNPNANLLLGDSYVKLNQYENAEKALKDYELTFPDDTKVKMNVNQDLSKIYMDQKDYKNAVLSLKQVVMVDPHNFDGYQNLGVAHFQLKEYSEAAVAWERALALQKDAQTFKFLGFSYYNLGDFPKAISNYQQSIKMNPNDSETYYNLAVAYNDNSLYDEAADAFDQAFRIDPKDSNAAVGKAQAIDRAIDTHMEKANGFLLNNQYSDAISEWQKVLKYQPDNKQAQDFITDAHTKLSVEVDRHYTSGMNYYKKGKALQALSEWNMALEMDPTNSQVQEAINKTKVNIKDKIKALVEEGDELYQEKDYAGASQKYILASNISPNNAGVKSRLKKLKTQQGTEFEKYYSLGQKGLKSGDLKNALKSLETASRIDPNNPKIKEALFFAKKEIRNKVDSLLEEGASLLDNGSKSQAQSKFQDVLNLDPNNDKANDYFKKLTGQQSQEKVDAEKVKALYYDGINLYINGKINEAIKKWQECLQQDPGNINAQKNIEKARAKLNSIARLNS